MSDNENKRVRDPFAIAVARGEVLEFIGAHVLRSVNLDPRWKPGVTKGDGFASKADLVLVKAGVGISIVECKLKTNGGAKHGCLEQVLMYGEMAECLREKGELAHRLETSKAGEGCKETPVEVIDSVITGLTRASIRHVVVFDTWGKESLPNTVGRTVRLINRALTAVGVPGIGIFARDDSKFHRVDVERT